MNLQPTLKAKHFYEEKHTFRKRMFCLSSPREAHTWELSSSFNGCRMNVTTSCVFLFLSFRNSFFFFFVFVPHPAVGWIAFLMHRTKSTALSLLFRKSNDESCLGARQKSFYSHISISHSPYRFSPLTSSMRHHKKCYKKRNGNSIATRKSERKSGEDGKTTRQDGESCTHV